MKPAKFKYYRASSIDEAISLLSEHGYDAKLLAGGQSLVPAMNFRLAQPAILVDLNFIKDLSYIKEDKKKGVLIGPMTRHRTIERDSIIKSKVPLLHQTMPFIAHPQIRNRGTVGGSIVHADPAAELPAIALALDASFHVRNKEKDRWVNAQEFFTGMFSTAMKPDEMLIEIAIPNISEKRYGYSFNEVARRHGDYAIVGSGVSFTLDKKNRCENVKIVFLSVGDAPVLAKEACAAMKGEVFSEDLVKNIAEIASTKDIDPGSDIHASAKYRRHLAKILTTKKFDERFSANPQMTDEHIEQESVWDEKPQVIEPIYKIDEKPKKLVESILYGWQHTLVDISPFVLPLAIASQMGMSQIEGARFVNCCLFAIGIATIIQTTIGNRLPIVQGPSATHTAVIKSVAPICGPLATWFAILIGSIVEMLIGAFGILKHLRKFFPIYVSGCVVICIGLSLGQVAMTWTIGDGSASNIFLAGLVIMMILALQSFTVNICGGFFARSSIFISIWFVGLFIAGFMGKVNWSIVAEKEWFSFPILFPFTSFEVEWNTLFLGALLGILAGYIGSILESIGDYAATCAAAGENYTIQHMNKGIMAEGFACALSAFLGAMPCTSYSQNIGIISTTKIASRYVVQIAAIILICYGLCPKFGALLVAMPRSVLGAVFIIVCGMISMSGVRLLSAGKIDSSTTMIVGVTLICAIAIPNVMKNQNFQLPLVLEILTKNTVVIAVVLGVSLNAFFVVAKEKN